MLDTRMAVHTHDAVDLLVVDDHDQIKKSIISQMRFIPDFHGLPYARDDFASSNVP